MFRSHVQKFLAEIAFKEEIGYYPKDKTLDGWQRSTDDSNLCNWNAPVLRPMNTEQKPHDWIPSSC